MTRHHSTFSEFSTLKLHSLFFPVGTTGLFVKDRVSSSSTTPSPSSSPPSPFPPLFSSPPLVREEGPSALYKGFVPKALRLGIGQTIGFVTFKECLRIFGEEE